MIRAISCSTVMQCARAIALIVLVGGCDAPRVTRPDFAYDPTVLTARKLYHWTSGTTIRVWAVLDVNDAIDLGVATRTALSVWNAVPQFAEYSLVMASSIDSADVVIYDRASAAPVTPGSCAFDPRGAAGYTYFCPGSGIPTRAEHLTLSNVRASSIVVVMRVDRGQATSQSAYNALVAHEFGHALGIGGHSDSTADVMYGAPTKATPTTRDIATLRYVLGQVPAFTL